MITSLFRNHRRLRLFAQPGCLALALLICSCAGDGARPAAVVAGGAISNSGPDFDLVQGCWRARDGAVSTTMQWTGNRAGLRGVWAQNRMDGRGASVRRYRVEASMGSWRVCGTQEDACWQLDVTAPTEAGEPAVRATLAATPSTLLFQVHDGPQIRRVFEGAREECG